MAATLKDLYDAYQDGASRATLIRLIEELDLNRIPVPSEIRQAIAELTDVDDDEEAG